MKQEETQVMVIQWLRGNFSFIILYCWQLDNLKFSNRLTNGLLNPSTGTSSLLRTSCTSETNSSMLLRTCSLLGTVCSLATACKATTSFVGIASRTATSASNGSLKTASRDYYEIHGLHNNNEFITLIKLNINCILNKRTKTYSLERVFPIIPH